MMIGDAELLVLLVTCAAAITTMIVAVCRVCSRLYQFDEVDSPIASDNFELSSERFRLRSMQHHSIVELPTTIVSAIENSELIVVHDMEAAFSEGSFSHEVDHLPRQKLSYQQFNGNRNRSSFQSEGRAPAEVSFTAATDKNRLVLKWWVREKAVRAVVAHDNGKVWEDSCVEFFCSTPKLAAIGYYLNFEFNCIGTLYSAFGTVDKKSRKALPSSYLAKIWRTASLGETPFQKEGEKVRLFEANEHVMDREWTLAVAIPGTLLFRCFADVNSSTDEIENDFEIGPSQSAYVPALKILQNLELTGNVYKCGDKLPQPHWLSLFEINDRGEGELETPDFHRPDAFKPCVRV
eukprot:g2805.t1